VKQQHISYTVSDIGILLAIYRSAVLLIAVVR
jgi:hypothetical protein